MERDWHSEFVEFQGLCGVFVERLNWLVERMEDDPHVAASPAFDISRVLLSEFSSFVESCDLSKNGTPYSADQKRSVVSGA
jgi:hypothetical protein